MGFTVRIYCLLLLIIKNHYAKIIFLFLAMFRTRFSVVQDGRSVVVEQVEKRRQSELVEQYGHVERRRKTVVLM